MLAGEGERVLCAYPVQLLGEDSSVPWAEYTGNTKQNLGALLKTPLNNFAQAIL